jgi:glutamate-1-semialdehyde 2,1-aminomutase
MIRRREEAVMVRRVPQSASMLRRAHRSMPNGVPMAWMSGLYRFPPIFAQDGDGPVFTDIDGNRYLDFNLCDLSVTMGFNHPAIVAAVSGQICRGAHFLLPTEDTVIVAELLAQRVGLPLWQFTLSASGANTEVIRLAREFTRREKVVVFDGHYHGHIDETLVKTQGPRSVPSLKGLSQDAARHTVIVPFNNLEALDRLLAEREVALVLTEPALTNCNVVLPEQGFLDGVRALTQRHGTLLCLDEAHTFQFAFGGLAQAWGARSDFVVLGKGLGTGVSFGLYGMSDDVGKFFRDHTDIDIGPAGIATGGTTYASALAAAAARAALEEVLLPASYASISALGEALADGLERLFEKHGLNWRAFRCGPRSGYCLTRDLPRNGREAGESLDADLIDTRRLFMANRGIWDAVASAGPQASFVHKRSDIAQYLEVADSFLEDIAG